MVMHRFKAKSTVIIMRVYVSRSCDISEGFRVEISSSYIVWEHFVIHQKVKKDRVWDVWMDKLQKKRVQKTVSNPCDINNSHFLQPICWFDAEDLLNPWLDIDLRMQRLNSKSN